MTRIGLLVVTALFVLACGADQTAWPKTAGDTSCAEWIDQMTPAQQSGLANAMLDSLTTSAPRRKADIPPQGSDFRF